MCEKLLLRLQLGHESTLLKSPLQVARTQPQHTHRWTVFIRGPHGEILDSQFIQKVTFQLHQDFPNSKRVVKGPPYEVTETGYAGFTVPISVCFVACLREYTFNYDLHLSLESQDKKRMTKTLEFRDPKPVLRQQLIKYGAEVKTVDKAAKVSASPVKKSQFENLFGPTLSLQQKEHQIAKKPSPRPLSSVSQSPTPKASKSRKQHKKQSSADRKQQSSSGKTVPKPHGAAKVSLGRSNSETELRTSNEAKPGGQKAVSPSCVGSPPPSSLSRSSKRSSLSSPPSPHPNNADKSKRPLDKALVERLCEDFGGDASDAETIVKRAKTTLRASSPLFSTGDSSPEPSLDNEVETIMRHRASPQRALTPRMHKDSPLGLKLKIKPLPGEQRSKQKTSIGTSDKAVAVKSVKVEPAAVTNGVDARLERLVSLQRNIMTLQDPALAEKVAVIVAKKVAFELDGDFLEFDLCSLEPALVDELCSLFEK